MARRTGEGAAVAALLDEQTPPAVFAPLIAAIGQVNPDGGRRWYPGSPTLIAGTLRPGDRLIACEARPEDARALVRAVGAQRARRGDGWQMGLAGVPAGPAPALVLVDPPYEAAGEAGRIVAFAAAVLRRNQGATIAVWAPIKDLASFDGLRAGLGSLASGLAIEARLRPLTDPLRLNGCALLVLNPGTALADRGREAARWVVERLGEAGGESRVATL